MKKILLIICIVVAIVFKAKADETSSYTIEKKTCAEPYKCSYDVRIESKLSEDELLTISLEIIDNLPAVNNVFIMFYLPCMNIGLGAWASAIASPLPKIKINIMDYMLTTNSACIH